MTFYNVKGQVPKIKKNSFNHNFKATAEEQLQNSESVKDSPYLNNHEYTDNER